ncbi:GIY-YIG nuclease family protein [Streptomyces prunicolor]|uniref:GIY-YIG nuclease family protein n=1 Tax=Streptomyces prunicolor TaxID=67348 RepID=UPI0034462FF5
MDNSVVYVIGANALTPVKIGVSINLPGRLKALQTGSAFRLGVLWSTPGDGALEILLHARFRAYQTHGEWFDLTPLGDPVAVVQEAVMQIRARDGQRADLVPAAPLPGPDPEYGGMRLRIASDQPTTTGPLVLSWDERFNARPWIAPSYCHDPESCYGLPCRHGGR